MMQDIVDGGVREARRAMKRRMAAMVLAITFGSVTAGSLQARPTLSLDGEWAFRFAPDDRGEQERWYSKEATGFDRRLTVPGCWDAQGVGEATDKMRHHAVGVGWYRRTVELPAEWSAKRVCLHVGGAHRSARVWVNGKLVGEHWGYPVAFRFDVTDFLEPGNAQTLVIAVDSRRHPERDPLTGTFDIIDYMHIDWGGIHEHVWLACTDDVWIEDAFVIPDPAHANAKVEVTVGHHDAASPGEMKIAYAVHRWSRHGLAGKPLDTGAKALADTGTHTELVLDLADAPLWTPAEPNLLMLKLRLLRSGNVVDEKDVRFGQRRLEIRGADFYLNGERFFLRGYGDDFNFPRELVPPADVGYWREYLQLRKNYGFNGVRHHSMIPTESYFTAADEVGLLVQPELPIAYRVYLARATDQGRELYRNVWETHIRQLRNHPSVMAWCMGNELYEGLSIDKELYEAAKKLDPTRPVISTDGMIPRKPLDTCDYATAPLNEWAICWGAFRNKYRLDTPLDRPMIVHEMSNFCALPDPRDIPLFTGAVKPFWLERMRDAVDRQGLWGELPAMRSASERLQASLLKLTWEAARLSPDVDGYHQWLFRDYWTQSSGLVNDFDRPRKMAQVVARRINRDAALLWDRNRASWFAGDAIDLRVFLSDFRPAAAAPIHAVHARWNDAVVALTPPAQAGGRGLIGPWTGPVTAPEVSRPRKLILIVEGNDLRNEWPVWVFPRVEPTAPSSPAPGVVLTRRLTDEVLDKLAAGQCVWLMDERFVLPTAIVQFKSAWWLGKPTNTNYGTMIVPHPVMDIFPHDGYGDLQMSDMMDNRPVVLMDKLPEAVAPVIWSIDVPWRMGRRAYLFEARVGRGRLLVSTLRFTKKLRETDPATAWLYRALLAYAGRETFQPRGAIPLAWLTERVRTCTPPDEATWLDGYSRLIDLSKRSDSHAVDYELNRLPSHLVEQTDGQQFVRWWTAKVPADWSHETVTFIFRGGFGARSEPQGGPFTLLVNGEPAMAFSFARETSHWSGPSGLPKLQFFARYQTKEDSFGVFFVTLPMELVRPGKPVELTVKAGADHSGRWFALNPYGGLAARERSEQPW
jgi:beta-galactosidase